MLNLGSSKHRLKHVYMNADKTTSQTRRGFRTNLSCTLPRTGEDFGPATRTAAAEVSHGEFLSGRCPTTSERLPSSRTNL